LTDDNNRFNSKTGKKDSLYYCKEHPKFESIFAEEIKNHLRLAKEYAQENPDPTSYPNKGMKILSENTTSC
jgi:hypothetical protein